ncbi:Conserved_hypothetical protein [Hexamita inflata]|uniref:Uncharacterized protein n=1 Tax=Hexamita inflata TaxID=28002 RepID=A0AA86Q6V2_9EUKA|nr:Conserved hypothetical protein [Hexamita inflata]
MLLLDIILTARQTFHVNQSEYNTLVITDILQQIAPYYLVKAPESTHITINIQDINITEPYHYNITSHLQKYRMKHNTSNYTTQYLYAAYQYLQGVRLLFGINCSRDSITGISHIQVASRFGCNEATSLLANAHKTGQLGVSQSPALAFNYYKELFHSWAACTADVHSYQYKYNKQFVDFKLGGDSEKTSIPKSERQHYIVNSIESAENRADYGNILASGILTGSYGFKKNEEMAARFAFLSASNEYKIKMDPSLNSIENVLKYEETEEEVVINREIEIVREKEPEKKEEQDVMEQVKDKIAKLLRSSEDEDLELGRYQSYSIPGDLKSKLEKYMDKYIIDDINVIQFNQTLPLTPDAFYDAAQKLAREVCWKIYTDYQHFKIFKQLKDDNATKDEVYEYMLYTNNSLINYAVRIFIDKTDTDANLQLLRNENPYVDNGYDVFYDHLKNQPQLSRSWKETCSRRGQAFGLMSYFLNGGVLTPQVVENSKMNKNLGRIFNLGSVYYGCHMGLSGLSFLALEGFRPLKNPLLDQKTLTPINGSKNNTEIFNGHYVKPEPKQALMSLDIASQAGSFESSYYESLLLSQKIFDFGPELKLNSNFYFHPQFKDIGYTGIDQLPALAKLLADHAGHAGHLGGLFLSGVFWEEGYGTFSKNMDVALQKMKRASQRLTTDWAIEDYTEVEKDDTKRFGQYLVHALSGDTVSLTNLFRFMQDPNETKVCMNDRKGQETCEYGQRGFENLALELAAAFSDNEPSALVEYSKVCKKDITKCFLAVHGFESYIELKKQPTYLKYLRAEFTQNGELDKYLQLFIQDFNKKFIKNIKTKLQERFQKPKSAKSPVYDNTDELRNAVRTSKIPSKNDLLINELKTNAKQSKFARVVYQCYYDPEIDFNFLRELYPSCMLIKNILVHISGSKMRQYQQLSVKTDLTSEDTKHFVKEDNQYINSLILELVFKYPDMYLLNLFELQSIIAVKLCNYTKFDSVQETTYALADVYAMLSQKVEHSTDAVYEILDMLNNVHKQEPMNVVFNKLPFYGFYSAEMGGFKEYYDFCKNPVENNQVQTKLILQPYLLLQCHLEIVIILCIVAIGLFYYDYQTRRKPQVVEAKIEEPVKNGDEKAIENNIDDANNNADQNIDIQTEKENFDEIDDEELDKLFNNNGFATEVGK